MANVEALANDEGSVYRSGT
ncbi:NVEALA domain-containing protein [Phocaeicola coprocola]|nr:NVEALA domain-containing protein [Phocaeicola coprocola]